MAPDEFDAFGNRIEPEGSGQVSHAERLGHRTGISQAGSFNQHVVESLLCLEQVRQALHKITAHPAAKAAIVQLHDLLVDAHNQFIIDADFAEFIDDDGAFMPVRLRQKTVEQRRLARPKKSGEHRNRNRFL